MVLEDVEKELLLGIDDDADAAALEAGHDLLVDVIRQRLRDGAGEHEGVALGELVELGEELFALCLADVRALAIDLGLFLGLDLDIDAREALRQLDEVVLDAEAVELALDLFAREACREAERGALMAEVAEDDGDVDALAAAEDLLVVHAVDLACGEGIEADDVVERRVESYGVDHSSLTLLPGLSCNPDTSCLLDVR